MRTVSFLALLSLAACGPSMADNASAVSTQTQELQALVDAHASAPASAAPSTCASEMERYRVEANRLLGSMDSRCPGLDACMAQLGRPGEADLTDGVRALQAELDTHVAGCCAMADVPAELRRHREAMLGHCAHVQNRSQVMMGAMGGMRGGACR